ncbi:hypothetical protein [Thalassobacillus sp. C254]|uniref:hypothetical protein n=1 Tax=Thalassobacillus sp. C254 TaxID=1225341 RepID=UPI000A70FB8B|nr:hypothetical protein [Thalassobacillus sp. C254]
MKTRVGVFFGGVSVEHEVSVISALQAINEMDSSQYEVIPVYISKDRNWYTGEQLLDIDKYKDIKKLLSEAQKVIVTKNEAGGVALQKDPAPKFGKKIMAEIDVASQSFTVHLEKTACFKGYLNCLTCLMLAVMFHHLLLEWIKFS